MAEVRDVPPQAQEFRLTGPYGRIVYDEANKKSTLVEYKPGDMMTPTHEELAAHPDRFEEWPPAGTVLEGAARREETPPDAARPGHEDEPHSPRSRR